MKSHLRNVLAIASAVYVLGLMYGYVGAFGFESIRDRPTQTRMSLQIARARVDDGGLTFVYSSMVDAGCWAPSSGYYWTCTAPRLKLPPLGRCLWEFNVRSLKDDYTNTGAGIYFACPIWCLALPGLISPWRWLRNRRRNDGQGFDVLPTRA